LEGDALLPTHFKKELAESSFAFKISSPDEVLIFTFII
jgi:hypothetical protein